MTDRRSFLALAGAAAGAAGFAHARSPEADERLFLDGLALPVGPAGRCLASLPPR